jgi:predicted dehydrogenase
MRQLFQNFKTGATELIECPYPQCKKGHMVVESRVSLISLGTERMLVEFSKSNLLQKAKQQPDKVKQVLDKIKTDGLLQTIGTVMERLDEPLPLGYCNAGVVIEAGSDCTGFKAGDRVISNGPHAEIVSVPKNLVARIPDGVSFECASFTVAGSIGLQGIRLASPQLGENVVVIGLGLIGQLIAQLLKANGCRVIVFDLDPRKTSLAEEFGIEASTCNEPVNVVVERTAGVGADCVIIAASGSSEEILSQSAKMCRKRGKIVLVGVIPLNVKRADFYEKELSFQVSCSYGPGRYDPAYEQSGIDYPLPFVRWTEQRNFETVLQCLANGSVNPLPLITERVSFDKAPALYDRLRDSKSIATIITYPEHGEKKLGKTVRIVDTIAASDASVGAAIIGTGNFTKMTLLPALKRLRIPVRYLYSQTGTNAPHLARKYGIEYCTTDIGALLDDKNVTCVFITTRHRSHVDLSLQVLKKDKHVFVEKPLAVNRMQFDALVNYFQNTEGRAATLTVGFNRRYSPLAVEAKKMVEKSGVQFNMVFTMNAGSVPANHWLQSPEEGGRIIGEACHCIDLFSFFAGSPVVAVCAASMGTECNVLSDNVSILLKSKNGNSAAINYYANGSKKYEKERIELFAGNSVVEIDNFRRLNYYGKTVKKVKLLSPDKGHLSQFRTYGEFVKGNARLNNSLAEHLNVTEASIAAVESLKENRWIQIGNVW